MRPRYLSSTRRRAWPLVLALAGCTGAGAPAPAPAHAPAPAPAPATPGLPPLDVIAAAKVAEAIRLVDPSLRPMIAARGLAELEVGRLDPRLLAALDAIPSLDPRQRGVVIAAELTDPRLRLDWSKVCKRDLAATLAAIAVVAPADKVKLLGASCDLDLVSRPADRPQADVMALLLALAIHAALAPGGELHHGERDALAELAATPLAAEGPPPPT